MKVNIGPYEEPRVIDIEIHDFDVWNLDQTLGMIILPCLKRLKEKRHGSPTVANKDVPKNLRTSKADDKAFTNKGTTDNKFAARWDYVLDEMIFAFEFIQSESLIISDKDWVAGQSRADNGFQLFGKYYRNLWD